jgi:uncharacterized protein (TIGR03435 family)
MRSAAVLLVIASATLTSAQDVPSPPAFDVASVKPNLSGTMGSSGRTGKGSVIFTNMTLRSLIGNAYDIRGNRIAGAPGWIDSERFDINARAAADTPDSGLAPMMRTLLADRFKLKVRHETREEAVYALVVARDDRRLGPNLRPAADCVKGAAAAGRSGGGAPAPLMQAGTPAPCGSRMMADGRGVTIQSGMQTMATLAGMLRGVGGREVVDRTGLGGTFDFELRYAPDALSTDSGAAENPLPNVFTALQEQLGLKLESARGPVEYLVVESVDRPTPD